MTQHLPLHGGSDAWGVPPWDFSTNSNAAGPCPHTQTALAQTDASHYPDPAYTQLRGALAALHTVAPQRIVIGASGSELIARFTHWIALHAPNARSAHTPATVWLPAHAYGDYAHAARQHGLQHSIHAAHADLVWLCAPSSPHGQPLHLPPDWPQRPAQAITVLDYAYAPLQLTATPIAPGLDRTHTWQIWTPNKALGLCGIRAAYAIAPADAAPEPVQQLIALAPSWPLGSHGVALLHSWCTPVVQTWLAHARHTLAQWKQQQLALLQQLDWECLPSETNFLLARPRLAPQQTLPELLAGLRQNGIKLRDATSFGLPGWVRLCVHTPQAQAALTQAVRRLTPV